MEGIKEESRVLITRENVGDVVKGDSILVEKLSDYESKGFGYSEIVGIVQVVESNYMDVYYTPITLVGKLFPYIFEEDGAICYKIITPDIKESNFSDVEKRKERLTHKEVPPVGTKCTLDINMALRKILDIAEGSEVEIVAEIPSQMPAPYELGVFRYIDVQGIPRYHAVSPNCFTPVKTEEEKIRDVMVEAIIGDRDDVTLETKDFLYEDVDKIIACGKITITLNEEN